ncbi:uncharacterized protein [Gossypium hirsutum]|uniref:RNase H type-1 domain-containing protein n=1 Tax=Gossypium hirsutum TaxID=3635 RepID=A0ABM2YWA9_GOSHI|nr:uncharacterized protein LOC121208305 [Gossypium hirsutum]
MSFGIVLDVPKEHSQTRSIALLWHMGPVGVKKQAHALFTATRAIQSDTSSGMTIHFDAAFNRRDFKSMASLVVRDQMGVILATKTVLNSNVSTSFAAEAYAGLHSINLGLSMGIHSVTVKGDSRTIIKKCQTSMQDKSVIGAIISDIQKKSEFFQEIRFQFINRIENILAHKIAEEVLRRGEETHLEGEALHHIYVCSEGRWSRLPD